MQKTTDTPKDPEAILLSRVYSLILSWGGEAENETPRADTPRKTRKPKIKKHAEEKE